MHVLANLRIRPWALPKPGFACGELLAGRASNQGSWGLSIGPIPLNDHCMELACLLCMTLDEVVTFHLACFACARHRFAGRVCVARTVVSRCHGVIPSNVEESMALLTDCYVVGNYPCVIPRWWFCQRMLCVDIVGGVLLLYCRIMFICVQDLGAHPKPCFRLWRVTCRERK